MARLPCLFTFSLSCRPDARTDRALDIPWDFLTESYLLDSLWLNSSVFFTVCLIDCLWLFLSVETRDLASSSSVNGASLILMLPNQDKGKSFKRKPQRMQEAPIPTETRFSTRLRGLMSRTLAKMGISTRPIWTTIEMIKMIKKNLLLKNPAKGLISSGRSFLAFTSLKICSIT